jgi:ubiquinone/menaquinone biosynthesis C-methylase UbiE
MKSLPKTPSLEFLKKEAKSLRALHKTGDTSCCEQIRLYDLSFKARPDTEIIATKFSINDAQRIIAREYGYSSWAMLKHYIESLDSPLYNGVADKAAYHQGIVDSYDERSTVYDNHVWAKEWSIKTVDFLPPEPGEIILDIACGTGTIAFYIADKIGSEGAITGVDISRGMLKRCNEKLEQSSFGNIQFSYGDVESLNFPKNSFDKMYCSAGLYWMTNPLIALRHWYELLKPGGWLGFSAWPSNSFVWGDSARQALRKHGIESTVHEFSGNKEKTQLLVELAGFSDIKIHEVERGRWMNAEDLKGPFSPGGYTPGQYPDPLEGVPAETLLLVQKDHEAAVDKMTTDKGVWHDMTTYFVYCQKDIPN